MTRETAVGISVAVITPSGDTQPFAVDSDRLVVGSGAHCEVRLSRDLAAREQLLLSASPDGSVRFEVKAHRPPTMLGTRVVSAGDLGPADVLRVGDFSLTARVTMLGGTKRRAPLEALAVVPAVLIMALTIGYAEPLSVAPRPPRAPALFVDSQAVCSAQDAFEAAQLARQRHALATEKRERGPFSGRDAVESVRAFNLASACFRLSGEHAKAHEDAANAATLRRKLEEEYRTRSTRLEHAFVEGDVDQVDRELPALTSLTAHLRDPYVDWLAQETRRAEAAATKPRTGLL